MENKANAIKRGGNTLNRGGSIINRGVNIFMNRDRNIVIGDKNTYEYKRNVVHERRGGLEGKFR